jgi:hypothetical protein
LHATQALANPRWEDFVYEYVDDNAGAWIGNGWTVNEREKKVNVDYLNPDQIDFPPVPVLSVSAALKREDRGGNDRSVPVSAP